MATKHILSLETPTVSNCGLLCIKDTSQYSTELAVDCPELLITLPGFRSTILIKVYSRFDMCLTACALFIQKEDCGTIQSNLPDGTYVIKYSVSPNDKVFVEYNHLRVTQLMTTYYEVLCDLDVQPMIPDSEKSDLLKEMDFIRTLIDAAVANVEYCNAPDKGMRLYNYAKQRLNKIICPSGNCGDNKYKV